MRKSSLAAMTVPLLLAACGPGPDRADNIPVAGRWSDELRLASVQVNGTAIDRAEVEGQLPPDKKEEYCGEPYYLDVESVRTALDEAGFKKCTIRNFKSDGARLNLSGSCPMPDSDGMAAQSDIKASFQAGPEKIVADISVNVIVTSSEGEGVALTAEYKRELVRLGDC